MLLYILYLMIYVTLYNVVIHIYCQVTPRILMYERMCVCLHDLIPNTFCRLRTRTKFPMLLYIYLLEFNSIFVCVCVCNKAIGFSIYIMDVAYVWFNFYCLPFSSLAVLVLCDNYEVVTGHRHYFLVIKGLNILYIVSIFLI